MIKSHEANRRHWNNQAATWEERLNRDGRWRRCHKEPELAFEGEALSTIREMVGDLRNKQVYVIGSGDNMAAYALSGLGAVVTSTDISEERLKLAASRAETLGVSIDFVPISDSQTIRPSIWSVPQMASLCGLPISVRYFVRFQES